MTEKIKRRRDPLSPKPILDRKLVLQALKQRGIHLKESHLDTFYHLLHRYHYPSLTDFVKLYYAQDNGEHNLNKENQLPSQHKISLKKGNKHRLPKAFLDFCNDPENDFTTITSSINARPTSKDGTTTKFAIELQDGHIVEAVLMRHVSASGSRATLCVSSQVGCAMGCTFCATGTMGIRGNLCSGEILEQLVHAGRVLMEDVEKGEEVLVSADGSEQKKGDQDLAFIRNIVFMGMGEPLNNYDNVLTACKAMIDRRRWNLAHGRVTVSTVGVTPNMRRLTQDLPEVNLALSLHAPNQPMREAIVPTAKMYPIQDMVEALDEHMMALVKAKSQDGTFNDSERKSASKRKRAMIEYVMLKGDTSTFECAHQLGKLCENKQLVVNLIPYNQTDVKDKLSCPSEEHMKEFQRIVTSYGSFCTIRRTMGADIAGACGQLVVAKEKQENKAVVGDIEDLGQSSKSESKAKPIVKATRQSPKVEKDISSENNENNYEKWIKPLAIGTAVSASICLVSIGLVMQKRRR